MKKRLDVILTEGGFAPSRERAKIMLMSGIVYVNGQKEDKPGTQFDPEKIQIEVRGETLRYVSRGGLKLEKALQVFPLDLSGKVCMDIGASTGGFTDCMLQNGAKLVYSIDVGYGQLDWKLRSDDRVICLEKTNFRYLTREELTQEGKLPVPDFASCDVSFISLSKILPAAFEGGAREGRQKGRCPRSCSPSGGHPRGAFLRGRTGIRDAGVRLFADPRTGRKHRVSDVYQKTGRVRRRSGVEDRPFCYRA